MRYATPRVDIRPELFAPWSEAAVAGWRHVGWPAVAGCAALVGLLGALVVRPVVGLGAGAVVLAARRWLFVRRALRLLPAAALAAAAAYIALRQARHHLPPIFEWPTFFFRARTLGWIVVIALAADVLLDLVSDRRARGEARPGP
jgi:hypothetical protein